VTAVSSFISVLLGMVVWFAKRELAQSSADMAKLKSNMDDVNQSRGKCPSELKLWVQQNFVTAQSFERQEKVVQESVLNFKSTLKQVDTNLAFLVKMNRDE